ncbi:metallophosphoesterase family protein [Heyndrickxia oleronia]|uniref:metallophosphoesterase family protein n=1 Tax=Heyndrickxia oleronia TaxID=38875 RepID=UPI001C0EE345|nr:metallophosphoesterase family protein [Heyndrickxia oleronia]MBU5212769.1 serine/threonine protein phosphatase [Heyndrickxia oleronia]
MRQNRILAISDIHGCYAEFIELLDLVEYNSSEDQLILLGDYMDRGKNSREVIYYVKELVEVHHAIALKGNHDKMFCDWLDDPIGQKERYFRNGAQETITSFLGQVRLDDISDSTYKAWAKEIIESNEELISFMKELPLFYEINDIIFVHAGINPEHNDWKMTNEHEMVWIRDPFLQADLPFDQTFIHGHTPAINLHDKADIFYGNKKIGIDGACVYGHQLNCLEIKNDQYREYFVKSKESNWKDE